jgi:hypothetical protein
MNDKVKELAARIEQLSPTAQFMVALQCAENKQFYLSSTIAESAVVKIKAERLLWGPPQ